MTSSLNCFHRIAAWKNILCLFMLYIRLQRQRDIMPSMIKKVPLHIDTNANGCLMARLSHVYRIAASYLSIIFSGIGGFDIHFWCHALFCFREKCSNETRTTHVKNAVRTLCRCLCNWSTCRRSWRQAVFFDPTLRMCAIRSDPAQCIHSPPPFLLL